MERYCCLMCSYHIKGWYITIIIYIPHAFQKCICIPSNWIPMLLKNIRMLSKETYNCKMQWYTFRTRFVYDWDTLLCSHSSMTMLLHLHSLKTHAYTVKKHVNIFNEYSYMIVYSVLFWILISISIPLLF